MEGDRGQNARPYGSFAILHLPRSYAVRFFGACFGWPRLLCNRGGTAAGGRAGPSDDLLSLRDPGCQANRGHPDTIPESQPRTSYYHLPSSIFHLRVRAGSPTNRAPIAPRLRRLLLAPNSRPTDPKGRLHPSPAATSGPRNA